MSAFPLPPRCLWRILSIALLLLAPVSVATKAAASVKNTPAAMAIVPPHTGPKKVLVTGAAGFVGSYVADVLLARGDQVVVVDEVNDYYDTALKESNLALLQHKYGTTGNLTVHRGDICNATFITNVFRTEKPAWICHMAARAGVRPSIEDPFVYIHSNVLATVRLMELAVEYKVHNFVFASSSSVYGGSPTPLFDEGQTVDHPISPYAATKKACELFSYTYHHLYDLKVTALRFFTVYGPRGRPDMAPFKFVDRISRGVEMQQFGDGSSSRDYTYIDDIVDGVVRAVDRPYPYQIINLGKGSGTKLSEFIGLVEKYTNLTAKIEQLPDQPGDVPYTCANVTKAQQLLGYSSTIPFEEGIQKTVEWYQTSHNKTAAVKKASPKRRRLLGQGERRLRDAPKNVTGSWEKEPIVGPIKGPKKVLVTGAAGFIGSHVADFLLERGDEVVVIDEVNEYYNTTIKEGNLKLLEDKFGKTNKLTIYRGDICDEDLLTKLFEKEKPDFICHMAARAGVRPSIQDPYIYVHSNVEATARLLELSRKHKVKNFVFASSSSVYGGSSSTFFSEDEIVDHPISPYAASKKSSELLAYTYHHLYQLKVTGLRFFTVYGPRGRPDMAPFKFIDRVSRGVEMDQFGDGSSSRDYTYIDDIVDGVVRAVDRPYPYQLFNLGKGSGTKLSEFIGLVEKYTGEKAVIKHLPDQPGDVPYTCADVRKAETMLGYKSSIPFEEGVKRTVEWYQKAYPENVKKTESSSKKPEVDELAAAPAEKKKAKPAPTENEKPKPAPVPVEKKPEPKLAPAPKPVKKIPEPKLAPVPKPVEKKPEPKPAPAAKPAEKMPTPKSINMLPVEEHTSYTASLETLSTVSGWLLVSTVGRCCLLTAIPCLLGCCLTFHHLLFSLFL